MKHIRIDPTKIAKGFITHEDWKLLSFEIINDIVKVGGKDEDVLRWADRVKGVEIAEKTATADLIKYKQDGIKAEIAYHQAMVTELSAKVTSG